MAPLLNVLPTIARFARAAISPLQGLGNARRALRESTGRGMVALWKKRLAREYRLKDV